MDLQSKSLRCACSLMDRKVGGSTPAGHPDLFKMSEVAKEQSPQERGKLITSPFGGRTFEYLGITPWELSPLKEFQDLNESSFPKVQLAEKWGDGYEVLLPKEDMIIRSKGLPPILFTGHHNRLLYECLKGLLCPNPQQTPSYY